MKIHNVRFGHATNSSSSHSIIFMANPPGTDAEGGSFGWEDFVLSDKGSKSRYMAVALANSLHQQTTPEITEAVIRSWLPASEWDPADYIDHQSTLSFPSDWSGKGPDKAFFDAYMEYILSEGVVILGGNDNSDGHPLSAMGNPAAELPSECRNTYVVRRDGTTNHWTLFDRVSGTKVRLSLDNTAAPQKSLTPELVDVKITDYCPYSCRFCYMDSTIKGAHAETAFIENIAHRFGNMKVFEVAIGGGEPTMHPDFLRILQTFKRAGVVPNFTTRNMAWLHDPDLSSQILDTIGAFALSVDNAEPIEKFAALLALRGVNKSWGRKEAHVQYVVGASHNLPQVLEACSKHNLPLTLLGYKMDGRGANGSKLPAYDAGKYERETWLKTVVDFKKANYIDVGVDTCLIQHAGEQNLLEAGVHESLWTKREGAFSMFVDGVARTMAPASYGAAKQAVPVEDFNPYSNKPDPMIAAFAKF